MSRKRSILSAIAISSLLVVLKQMVLTGPSSVSAETMPTVESDTIEIDNARDSMPDYRDLIAAITARPETPPSVTFSADPFFHSQPTPGDDADRDIPNAAQQLVLRAIMRGQEFPVCLINNRLVREQQEVAGFTVDEIRQDSVIVHRNRYRFELKVVK